MLAWLTARGTKRRRWIACGLGVGLPVLVLLALVLACLINAWSVSEPDWHYQLRPSGSGHLINDSLFEERLGRFQAALRIPTISVDARNLNESALEEFKNFLQTSFPRLHGGNEDKITCEVVSNYSFLYEIKGSDESLTPYLLAAHLDVVPVEEDKWNYDPFEAMKDGEYIYARGAFDDKHAVMGILEALDYFLFTKNESVKRTFYVGIGHDEEVSGRQGAAKIAEVLHNRGVKTMDFVLDEGFVVLTNALPGVQVPVALVGVSEKGYAEVSVSVDGVSGHSSMPPKESAIGIISKAVSRLEAYPQPHFFDSSSVEYTTLETAAPHSSFLYKLIYSNLWLFKNIVSNQFLESASTAATVRTTTAPTLFNAGYKINVVPSTATAYINHRVHPKQTIEDVLEYDREVIGDSRVNVTLNTDTYIRPHPISPYGPDSPQYKLLARSILEVFPQSFVAPGTMIATTDTKYYLNFSKNVYRFAPTFLDIEDMPRLHGHDERIRVENYREVVDFFFRLMVNANQVNARPLHVHARNEL
ncbi:unnamed protein product [Darwinula stevensoni]|uniref:Peptidase M20 dimerisation domain-containing protein n=1 Tax=Darwinula stevensoni TaxID=69355 RepID=A0A7R9A465_9CRUS|nr:unnamed protein product [Darwinula stevensoni]CAG0883660.1 unnamed protein product [Darwinula stevensoni]